MRSLALPHPLKRLLLTRPPPERWRAPVGCVLFGWGTGIPRLKHREISRREKNGSFSTKMLLHVLLEDVATPLLIQFLFFPISNLGISLWVLLLFYCFLSVLLHPSRGFNGSKIATAISVVSISRYTAVMSDGEGLPIHSFCLSFFLSYFLSFCLGMSELRLPKIPALPGSEIILPRLPQLFRNSGRCL